MLFYLSMTAADFAGHSANSNSNCQRQNQSSSTRAEAQVSARLFRPNPFAKRSRALAQAGFDDIPRNGLYIIGGLAMGADDVPLGQLVKELGVPKQSVAQLLDTLVLRGYLQRKVDAADRSKLTVTLTERGRAAAATQAAAREKIDAELTKRVGAEDVSRTRRTLAALIDLGCEQNEAHPDEP
jgi:DNA-binding MarR family transcriptional regulator